MQNYKEQILSIISSGSLTPEENNLWEETIKNVPEGLCPDILWFLQSTPNGISIMTDNIKEKVAAIKTGDLKKWEEILNKEGDFLKSIDNQK